MLRQRSEGYGRPIISLEFKGYRLVAVGKRIAWSKDWHVFPDFLMYNLKDKFGQAWGERESKRSPRVHPLFVWMDEMRDDQMRHRAAGGGSLIGSSGGGPTAFFRLAYAIYLMEHHDKIPPRFMKRLRNPATFAPAAYEALVGAAYAMGGYEIRSTETPERREVPRPEFTATLQGVTYAVEAKRKKEWRSHVDVRSEAFLHELDRFIRNELMSASRKRLSKPVYWLELSIPKSLDEAEAEFLKAHISAVMRDLERTFRIKGELPDPAYVFVTNHTFLADSHAGSSWFTMLEGFHRTIYPEPPVEVTELLAQHDAHRPATTVLRAFREAASVPTSFDAVPAELLGPEGRPITTMRVGEKLQIDLPDGEAVRGTVEDVTAAGDVGHVAIRSESDGKSHIVSVPLSEEEARAHAVHGDLIFGKPAMASKIEKDDIIGLYEWVLWAYRSSTREQLLRLVDDHRRNSELLALETEELRRAICREYTSAMVARANNDGTGSDE